MKTRIVVLGDGWKKLGKSKIFDWPFDQLPEKENTISKDLIPCEILWNNQGVDDFYCRVLEGSEYLIVVAINYCHDKESGESIVEIMIEI